MNTSQDLLAFIENAATRLNIAPSTVGERAGQGGQFYQRLKDGKRVWPETADAVRKRVGQMLSPSVLPDGIASPENVDTAKPAFKGKSQKTVPHDRGAA
jgi:hypothetical protein